MELKVRSKYHFYANFFSLIYSIFSFPYSITYYFFYKKDPIKSYAILEIPDTLLYFPLYLLLINSLFKLKKGFIDFDILKWLEYTPRFSKMNRFIFYFIAIAITFTGFSWIFSTIICITFSFSNLFDD